MSDEEIDDYEKLCQKNIEERKAFMQTFFSDIKKNTEEIQELEKKREELSGNANSKKNNKRKNNAVYKPTSGAPEVKRVYQTRSKTIKTDPTVKLKDLETSSSDESDEEEETPKKNYPKKTTNPKKNTIKGGCRSIKDWILNNKKKLKDDSTVKTKRGVTNLLKKIEDKRKKTADSILNFDFNDSRFRVLSNDDKVADGSKGVVYWMFRDVRVEDNWALLYAQKIALSMKIPLHVCFCLPPNYQNATLRHYEFLLDGLKEVEEDLQNLDINFHLLLGEPTDVLVNFIEKQEIGALICDFLPLRLHSSWVDEIGEKLQKSCAYFQVDAHGVVPFWECSSKLELTAGGIRKIIHPNLDEYLTEFPPVMKHPYKTDKEFEKNTWKTALNFIKVDKTVKKVKLVAGYKAAVNELEKFINSDLETYVAERNNYVNNEIANFFPYYHNGMISVQRGILELTEFEQFYLEAIEAYVEDVVIHKAAADNFCHFNQNYDNFNGAREWAQKSLNKHRRDKREYIYTMEEFENGETHDDLYNAAQNRLVKEGIMHRYLGMYWAKKILEWSESANQAIKYAVYFMEKYSINGRDPTLYLACMWSVCGVHDRAFTDRPVFGWIRYMSRNGCMKKYDLLAFVIRHAGIELQKGTGKSIKA